MTVSGKPFENIELSQQQIQSIQQQPVVKWRSFTGICAGLRHFFTGSDRKTISIGNRLQEISSDKSTSNTVSPQQTAISTSIRLLDLPQMNAIASRLSDMYRNKQEVSDKQQFAQTCLKTLALAYHFAQTDVKRKAIETLCRQLGANDNLIEKIKATGQSSQTIETSTQSVSDKELQTPPEIDQTKTTGQPPQTVVTSTQLVPDKELQTPPTTEEDIVKKVGYAAQYAKKATEASTEEESMDALKTAVEQMQQALAAAENINNEDTQRLCSQLYEIMSKGIQAGSTAEKFRIFYEDLFNQCLAIHPEDLEDQNTQLLVGLLQCCAYLNTLPGQNKNIPGFEK